MSNETGLTVGELVAAAGVGGAVALTGNPAGAATGNGVGASVSGGGTVSPLRQRKSCSRRSISRLCPGMATILSSIGLCCGPADSEE